MSEETENKTLVETAVRSALPNEVDPEVLYSIVTPPDSTHQVVNLERFLPEPDRIRGRVDLHNAESLTRFVSEHETASTKVYASKPGFKFVAVINDAHRKSGSSKSGWADHRATLQMTKTPEWLHWEGQDGKMMSQETFAEHIEDGLLEIVTPEEAEMVELAQTFHANTGVNFKSSTILSSGQRQITYEETTQARAGSTGQVTIPAIFELGIAPFEGTDGWKLEARLRFRSSDGQLRLGYRLNRPHEVLREAFDATAADISSGIESPVLLGTPPEGVSA